MPQTTHVPERSPVHWFMVVSSNWPISWGFMSCFCDNYSFFCNIVYNFVFDVALSSLYHFLYMNWTTIGTSLHFMKYGNYKFKCWKKIVIKNFQCICPFFEYWSKENSLQKTERKNCDGFMKWCWQCQAPGHGLHFTPLKLQKTCSIKTCNKLQIHTIILCSYLHILLLL